VTTTQLLLPRLAALPQVKPALEKLAAASPAVPAPPARAAAALKADLPEVVEPPPKVEQLRVKAAKVALPGPKVATPTAVDSQLRSYAQS
jgi:hypothetical protein